MTVRLTDPTTCLSCALATAVRAVHVCEGVIVLDGQSRPCLCPWCPPD